MKRFYATASASAVEGGFDVRLDGRPIRAPGGTPIVVPTQDLARAIAEEWQAQPVGGEIKPLQMPLMRLAATGLERVPGQRDKVIDDTAKYAGSDLLCYRATDPDSLVARQCKVWDPLLAWLDERHDARLEPASGVILRAQSPDAIDRIHQAVAAHDDLALAALYNLTTWMGSVVLALAVSDRRLDGAGAFEAAELDALFEIERWGADAEATLRHQRLRADIEAAARFLELLDDARLR
jgi:chaperone required for assembly of F1-ATPase